LEGKLRTLLTHNTLKGGSITTETTLRRIYERIEEMEDNGIVNKRQRNEEIAEERNVVMGGEEVMIDRTTLTAILEEEWRIAGIEAAKDFPEGEIGKGKIEEKGIEQEKKETK
jgi:hypothetical protein